MSEHNLNSSYRHNEESPLVKPTSSNTNSYTHISKFDLPLNILDDEFTRLLKTIHITNTKKVEYKDPYKSSVRVHNLSTIVVTQGPQVTLCKLKPNQIVKKKRKADQVIVYSERIQKLDKGNLVFLTIDGSECADQKRTNFEVTVAVNS
jgi:hypothetical protein